MSTKPQPDAATPRTDAQAFSIDPDRSIKFVPALFARALERELSAETARREEAEREVSTLEDKMPWLEDFNQLRASLATSEAQRADAIKERDKAWSDGVRERNLKEALAFSFERVSKARDEAVAQRAQAEVKVWEFEQRQRSDGELIDRYENALRAICLLLGFDPSDGEGTTGEDVVKDVKRALDEAESALTTERRAREQAEADAAVMREAVTHWMSEYENNLEASDKWIKWCEEQDPKDTHGMNFHQGMRSGVVHHQIALYKLIECCKSTNSGKPLLARLEKAEADVKLLRDALILCKQTFELKCEGRRHEMAKG